VTGWQRSPRRLNAAITRSSRASSAGAVETVNGFFPISARSLIAVAENQGRGLVDAQPYADRRKLDEGEIVGRKCRSGSQRDDTA
jgi:hypothetical protein